MDARIAKELAEIPSESIQHVRPGPLRLDVEDAPTRAADAVADQAINGPDAREIYAFNRGAARTGQYTINDRRGEGFIYARLGQNKIDTIGRSPDSAGLDSRAFRCDHQARHR